MASAPLVNGELLVQGNVESELEDSEDGWQVT